MPRISVMVLTMAVAALAAGCSSTGKSVRHGGSRTTNPTPDAFAAQRERESYVDSNYKQHLSSGRAKNESEARALAGLDWEVHHRRHAASNNETVRWDSSDAARRRQQAFEKELEDLDLK